jgi:hypothetical protein
VVDVDRVSETYPDQLGAGLVGHCDVVLEIKMAFGEA